MTLWCLGWCYDLALYAFFDSLELMIVDGIYYWHFVYFACSYLFVWFIGMVVCLLVSVFFAGLV